ncbi:MAG: hypothetical protein ACPLRA_05220 [Candidatus Saccharicenans sp.]
MIGQRHSGFRTKVLPFIFILTLVPGSLRTQGQLKIEETKKLDQALKIINFLDQAASLRQETGRFQGRIAEFSEEEVAAFFEQIFSEQASAFKSIDLKFFPGKKVEGRVLLDLSNQGLPPSFKPEVNLYFAARIEISQRKVRLNFSSLYIETQRVQPEIIDSLIALIARARGLEARSLESWYDLPEGVENLDTAEGKLLVYY